MGIMQDILRGTQGGGSGRLGGQQGGLGGLLKGLLIGNRVGPSGAAQVGSGAGANPNQLPRVAGIMPGSGSDGSGGILSGRGGLLSGQQRRGGLLGMLGSPETMQYAADLRASKGPFLDPGEAARARAAPLANLAQSRRQSRQDRRQGERDDLDTQYRRAQIEKLRRPDRVTEKNPILLYNPSTGEKRGVIPGTDETRRMLSGGWVPVDIQGTPGEFSELTGTRADQLRGRYDNASTAKTVVNELIQNVKENPGNYGAVGAVKGALQSGGAVFGDVFEATGIDIIGTLGRSFEQEVATGEVDPEIVSRFFNPDIPENEVKENYLAYELAKARKGIGRAPAVADVENAKNSVNLTGLTSSKDVLSRLQQISREFENAQRNLSNRLPGQSTPSVTRWRMTPEGTFEEVR